MPILRQTSESKEAHKQVEGNSLVFQARGPSGCGFRRALVEFAGFVSGKAKYLVLCISVEGTRMSAIEKYSLRDARRTALDFVRGGL